MSEQNFIELFSAAATEVEGANVQIALQNERLTLTSELKDEEFKQLALNGLFQEQRDSITRRDTAAAGIEYDLLGRTMLQDEKTINDLSEKMTELEIVQLQIQGQADISLKVSPSSKEVIKLLAQKKQAAAAAEVQEITDRLTVLNSRLLGCVAVGAAWPLPRVLLGYEMNAQAKVVAPNMQSDPTDIPETSAEKATNSLADNDMVLASIMWAVCEYAMKHTEEGVRVEEMRREVPELAQLMEDEYKFFKSKFATLRSFIEMKLEEKGMDVQWRVSGQKRGTRYHLTVKHSHTITMTRPMTPLNIDTSRVATPLNAQSSKSIVGSTVPPGFSPISEEMTTEELKKTPLIRNMLSYISNLQTERQLDALKRTTLVRELSIFMQLQTEDIGFLLSKLVAVGLIFERGNQKGTTLLSTTEDKALAGVASVMPEAVLTSKNNVPPKENRPKITQVSTATTPEAVTEPTRKISLVKWGRNEVNRGRWVASEAALQGIAKRLGIKDVPLSKEVEQWVAWLCENPVSQASNKISGAKAPVINLNGLRLPVWRLAPNKNTDLLTRPESRYMRVLYAFTDEELFLLDVVDHDRYVSKYLNRK